MQAVVSDEQYREDNRGADIATEAVRAARRKDKSDMGSRDNDLIRINR